MTLSEIHGREWEQPLNFDHVGGENVHILKQKIIIGFAACKKKFQ